MKLTVSEAREEIAEAANLCNDSNNTGRICRYINKAVRRLLPKGKWVGTVQAYRICVSDSCITWPRQIETIESVAVNGCPTKIRNQWFEYLENGPGVNVTGKRPTFYGSQLLDKGEYPCFNDIEGINKKIRVYADVPEASDAYITLQGYNENGVWIRTEVTPGNWIDGEKVLISTTPQLTSNLFIHIVRVIKPKTNGFVRLYEYDTDANVNSQALAMYENDETLPSYRRTYIPMVEFGVTNQDCPDVTVDVMAKLRFLPVERDEDFIMIGHLPALVEMVRAIRKFENNLFEEAITYEALAVRYLEEQLSSYMGSGVVHEMRTENPATYGGGGVENVI
jgi:hypothetical protein